MRDPRPPRIGGHSETLAQLSDLSPVVPAALYLCARAARATLTFARRLARTRRRGERVGRLGWERSRAEDADRADAELLPQRAEWQGMHQRRRVLPRQGAVACSPAAVRAPGELPVAPASAAAVHPRQPRSRPVLTQTFTRHDCTAESRLPSMR